MNIKPPSPDLVAANPELFTWLLGAFLAIALFFLVYHIVRSDKNNQRQWTVLNDHEKRISTLEGKCEVNHK